MITNPVLRALCFSSLLVAIGCSRGGASNGDAGPPGDGSQDAAFTDGPTRPDGSPPDLAPAQDLRSIRDLAVEPDLAAPPDLNSGILHVHILVDNLNHIHITPASYGVPAKATFKVEWSNDAGSISPVDIEKDDMFNHVPIVLGLDAGASYFDSVRPWCGIFTGTFFFRVTAGAVTADMPINCNI